MISKIRLLPENLINKIAAGEVIERPASVVKELMENSIDAGSDEITVEIRGGGKSLIRVTDNGIGMTYDDALLSLERHSTSKISGEKDLDAISTLGFRGEALPTITAVSKFNLITKSKDADVGTQILLEGGKIKDVLETSCSQGTKIEVHRLFYNTPARLKFLKSTPTELNHIYKVVSQYALVYPEIRFKLIRDQKIIVNAVSTKKSIERIANVFGRDFIKDLIGLNVKSSLMNISGFISKPSYTRASREYQYLFINKRLIRNNIITHAIYEGYKTLLMKQRHPVVILFMEIDPHFVDVNVHPTKSEVRFQNQNQIHDFIRDTISRSLQEGTTPQETISTIASPTHYPSAPVKKEGNSHSEQIKEAIGRYLTKQEKQEEIGYKARKRITRNLETPFTPDLPHTATLTPIGQIHNTYIISQNETEMLIIDQHAAHERILYEQLKESHNQSNIVTQGLLIPESIELTHKEADILQHYIEELNNLGLEIEHFGQNTFVIKSVPVILVGKNYTQIVRDIIDEISSLGKTVRIEEYRDKIITLMACRGAIKANHSLQIEEMQSLLQQLQQTKLPYTCPHGRPITISFNITEIKRKFKRT